MSLWIELKEISSNSRIHFKIMERLGSKDHLLLLCPCRVSKNKYNFYNYTVFFHGDEWVMLHVVLYSVLVELSGF